jgi:hypothetical protein
MITKVASIYPLDIQKHDHQQSKDGAKKRQQNQFKDILAKTITDSTEKSKWCKR